MLAVQPDGALLYLPDADYWGMDEFTYQATDGEHSSNVATVTMTVNPVNDAPVAGNEAYAVDEDNTLSATAPGSSQTTPTWTATR
jgi:VCBS repeat-containing protein